MQEISIVPRVEIRTFRDFGQVVLLTGLAITIPRSSVVFVRGIRETIETWVFILGFHTERNF